MGEAWQLGAPKHAHTQAPIGSHLPLLSHVDATVGFLVGGARSSKGMGTLEKGVSVVVEEGWAFAYGVTIDVYWPVVVGQEGQLAGHAGPWAEEEETIASVSRPIRNPGNLGIMAGPLYSSSGGAEHGEEVGQRD